jgi:hypothetical protein
MKMDKSSTDRKYILKNILKSEAFFTNVNISTYNELVSLHGVENA